MTDTVHHPATPEAGEDDIDLTPRARRAFEELRRAIFTDGALDSKTKQLIAVAVAHLTQCPHCIDGHTGLAKRAGATPQEITEAIWVATEIHAGGTFAHPRGDRHVSSNSTPLRLRQHGGSH